MSHTNAYITQAANKQEERKLKKYVENLDKTIQNVKWKQSLILTYNYVPLQTMRQKIESQRQMYVKRLQSGEARLSKLTQNERVMKQVQYFKNFSIKLYGQMTNIQQQIQQLKMGMKIRLAQIQAKKKTLKQILKQNAQLNKELIDQINQYQQSKIQGYYQKQNPKLLNSSRKQTQRSKTTSKSSRYTAPASIVVDVTKQIYSQCVAALVKSMKSMNASQDIQAGIYLEIMNKKIQMKSATYSLKSKICDIIMDRYKDLRQNKTKQNEDFSISLQTFLGLNWKQIMGILLIKDRNAMKLRNLLNQI